MGVVLPFLNNEDKQKLVLLNKTKRIIDTNIQLSSALPLLAGEQALLFGPSRLRRSLARSRETRFARPNRRACSQAIPLSP